MHGCPPILVCLAPKQKAITAKNFSVKLDHQNLCHVDFSSGTPGVFYLLLPVICHDGLCTVSFTAIYDTQGVFGRADDGDLLPLQIEVVGSVITFASLEKKYCFFEKLLMRSCSHSAEQRATGVLSKLG